MAKSESLLLAASIRAHFATFSRGAPLFQESGRLPLTRRWVWGLATALAGIVLLVALPAFFWVFD
jgi:hypothetical protein